MSRPNTIRVFSISEIPGGQHHSGLDGVQGGGEELLEVIFYVKVLILGDVEVCDLEKYKWLLI